MPGGWSSSGNFTSAKARPQRPQMRRWAGGIDHLIRPPQQRGWDREADGFGGLEVDDQLEFRRLLDRQVAGPGALEDLVDEDGAASCAILLRRKVSHQATELQPDGRDERCRQARLDGKVDDPLPLVDPIRPAARDEKRAGAGLLDWRERCRELLRFTRLERLELQAEGS